MLCRVERGTTQRLMLLLGVACSRAHSKRRLQGNVATLDHPVATLISEKRGRQRDEPTSTQPFAFRCPAALQAALQTAAARWAPITRSTHRAGSSRSQRRRVGRQRERRALGRDEGCTRAAGAPGQAPLGPTVPRGGPGRGRGLGGRAAPACGRWRAGSRPGALARRGGGRGSSGRGG